MCAMMVPVIGARGEGRQPDVQLQRSHRVRGAEEPGGHVLHELPPADPLPPARLPAGGDAWGGVHWSVGVGSRGRCMGVAVRMCACVRACVGACMRTSEAMQHLSVE